MSDPQAIWRAKTDDELLDAAEDLSEFTEEGERIIRAELRRRGGRLVASDGGALIFLPDAAHTWNDSVV